MFVHDVGVYNAENTLMRHHKNIVFKIYIFSVMYVCDIFFRT